MYVKIITRFKDKITLKWHEVGDKIMVSKSRYEEIKKFCVIIDEKKKKANKNLKGESM